jgi:hypothetical protein
MKLVSDNNGKKIIIDAPNIIQYKWISSTNTLCIISCIRVIILF